MIEVAEADARLIKTDPAVLGRRVNGAPPEKKMAVLMKCIDDLDAGSSTKARLVMIGFLLFLLLIFLAVMFGAGSSMCRNRPVTHRH